MGLLDSSLKKCEFCSFRKLIRNRDKAVKQSEFLREVAEELSDCSFPALIEDEIGDVSCQGDDVICRILGLTAFNSLLQYVNWLVWEVSSVN